MNVIREANEPPIATKSSQHLPHSFFARPAELVAPDLVGQHHDFGIEMVQALDAAHAQDIARAQHPQGRMSTVMALVTSQNPTFTFTGAWGFILSTWIGLLSSTLTWIGWALRTCTSTGVLLLTLRLIGIVSTTFTARLRVGSI